MQQRGIHLGCTASPDSKKKSNLGGPLGPRARLKLTTGHFRSTDLTPTYPNQCKKQNQVCSGKSTGTQVESCKMCAGTCHLTAFCSHISPKWRFLHRHAGKSVPARKKLFRQCAGTRSPQQHPPPLTWLGCLVLGCPFGVCAGVLVAFFAPQPVKHVSIHDPKIDLLFALIQIEFILVFL